MREVEEVRPMVAAAAVYMMMSSTKIVPPRLAYAVDTIPMKGTGKLRRVGRGGET